MPFYQQNRALLTHKIKAPMLAGIPYMKDLKQSLEPFFNIDLLLM